MADARCMKCKKQVTVKDEKEVVMKNGMQAISGVCGRVRHESIQDHRLRPRNNSILSGRG